MCAQKNTSSRKHGPKSPPPEPARGERDAVDGPATTARAEATPIPAPIGQFLNTADRVLQLLRAPGAGPLSLDEIADRLRLDFGAVASNVRFLAREGLIRQEPPAEVRYSAPLETTLDEALEGLGEEAVVIADTPLEATAAGRGGPPTLPIGEDSDAIRVYCLMSGNPEKTWTFRELLGVAGDVGLPMSAERIGRLLLNLEGRGRIHAQGDGPVETLLFRILDRTFLAACPG
ncbi:hypothetical protein OJF2_09290 [Aquisphaera giovannonii]|uniref:MarR family protein n=1 Tax=Aquisphaera giovannonii TaxID=406548 RepID=A0A5B9VW46_9BACT|nr:hypothetical protein [Aquisphaera giovannonii]QEH32458.1 hypothetical protein OJF2_09290 [Aquisphaera giovannonii]